MNFYAWKMRAPRSHYFLSYMSNRHLANWKKLKYWGTDLPTYRLSVFPWWGSNPWLCYFLHTLSLIWFRLKSEQSLAKPRFEPRITDWKSRVLTTILWRNLVLRVKKSKTNAFNNFCLIFNFLINQLLKNLGKPRILAYFRSNFMAKRSFSF